MTDTGTPQLPPLSDEDRRRIAHDFRNSIGAMMNAVELLVRRYEPEGREERLFGVFRTELDRLRALVDSDISPPRR